MNLLNIQRYLWCEPAAILPSMHKQICDIVSDHASGAAHLSGGRLELFEGTGKSCEDGFYKLEDGTFCGYRNGTYSENVPAGLKIEGDIGTINVHGVIAKRVSKVQNSSGVATNLEQTLSYAKSDEQVKGILLDIDSPGGSIVGTPEVAEMVRTLGKPTVAFTDSLIASAAYWIAAQCDLIVASPSADVGSIGVYSAFLDQSRAAEMAGLKVELFNTGKYKGMGMPGRALSDEQKEHIQAGVDKAFAWFKADVHAQRPSISEDAMQGQCFDAADALAEGLIERVGSHADALAELTALINAGF